ncbi:tetratricopeptide repeat protein [Sulfurospirillum sp. 1612]|uniref:tetratricopeptide repeat protein n=1 Tax=Sulfurospirillum sp. 1612 TaxID=3094835 RepID=UPI002F92BB64
MQNDILVFGYQHLALLCTAYIVLNLLVSILVAKGLEKRFPEQKKIVFLFFFLFHIVVPIVGFVFSIWIVYHMRCVDYPHEIKSAHMINMDEFEDTFITINRSFGEGSMSDLMINDSIGLEKKMDGLAFISENISNKNISIIKQNFSNQNDEIRLYSFAIINKMEKSLQEVIHGLLGDYKMEKNRTKKAALAKELAETYWEIIYYNLSDDALEDYYVRQVYHYLDEVLEVTPYDLSAHLLLGRIHMLQKRYDEATTEFVFIIESNYEYFKFVIPYLSEMYFNSKRYFLVKSLLSNTEDLKLNLSLNSIFEQWTAKHHD